MRPGVIPAPRRWVMVGCLQGRRREDAPATVNKGLTLKARSRKSSAAWTKGGQGPSRDPNQRMERAVPAQRRLGSYLVLGLGAAENILVAIHVGRFHASVDPAPPDIGHRDQLNRETNASQPVGKIQPIHADMLAGAVLQFAGGIIQAAIFKGLVAIGGDRDNGLAPWLQDPEELRHRLLVFNDMLQDVDANYRVEGSGWEWNVSRIGIDHRAGEAREINIGRDVVQVGMAQQVINRDLRGEVQNALAPGQQVGFLPDIFHHKSLPGNAMTPRTDRVFGMVVSRDAANVPDALQRLHLPKAAPAYWARELAAQKTIGIQPPQEKPRLAQ